VREATPSASGADAKPSIAPGAGCAATSLLSGTTFSDSEGDAAPAVALGPISIGGRAGPSSPGAGCKLGKVTEKKGITARPWWVLLSEPIISRAPRPGSGASQPNIFFLGASAGEVRSFFP
jgi:hypothetical protein